MTDEQLTRRVISQQLNEGHVLRTYSDGSTETLDYIRREIDGEVLYEVPGGLFPDDPTQTIVIDV